MKVFQRIAQDIIFNILEVSAQLSVNLGWFIPASIGLIIYMLIISNKQIRFLLTILVLILFVSSPLIILLPKKYYMIWSLNRGYLVSNNEILYFIVTLSSSVLISWGVHQKIDNFIEWISPNFLSKSKIKSNKKTDIESMYDAKHLVTFDPLKLEKQGFIALGRKA